MPKQVTAVLSVALLAGGLAGRVCRRRRDGRQQITVWTEENLEDRMAVQNQIIADVHRGRPASRSSSSASPRTSSRQVVTSAAAAGKLPDVIGALPLASVRQMEANDLLDTDAAGPGRRQARAGALLAAGAGARHAGRASSWPSLRRVGAAASSTARTCSQQAGLQRARHLRRDLRGGGQRSSTPAGSRGITLATEPKDSFTEQTFEHSRWPTTASWSTTRGNVALDSPAVRAKRSSCTRPGARTTRSQGTQDVDSTRATYFAGKAAMIVWSSFLLDELAGLRNDALPSCPQCKKDKTFLAKNTGVVTALQGPRRHARPVRRDRLAGPSPATPPRTPAAKFVPYMMNEGYSGWLGMAPEGKFPVRKGTRSPRSSSRWNKLPAGVDTKKPLGDIYPAEVLDALRKSPDTFAALGHPPGSGRAGRRHDGRAARAQGAEPTSWTAQLTAAGRGRRRPRRDVETIRRRGIRQCTGTGVHGRRGPAGRPPRDAPAGEPAGLALISPDAGHCWSWWCCRCSGRSCWRSRTPADQHPPGGLFGALHAGRTSATC